MNDDPNQDPQRRRPAPDEGSEAGRKPGEGDEVSALARHGDPSRQHPSPGAAQTQAQARKSGVVWVRPSDLFLSAGGRVAGRGIDFQAELARRTRAASGRAITTSKQAIRERALRLSPVSAFGRSHTTRTAPTRAGAGLR
jgi:hypothetical protein